MFISTQHVNNKFSNFWAFMYQRKKFLQKKKLSKIGHFNKFIESRRSPQK